MLLVTQLYNEINCDIAQKIHHQAWIIIKYTAAHTYAPVYHEHYTQCWYIISGN